MLKDVFLVGNFSQANVYTISPVGYRRKVDTSDFGNGHVHTVHCGAAAFHFSAQGAHSAFPSEMLMGTPVQPSEAAGHTFSLYSDGTMLAEPNPS